MIEVYHKKRDNVDFLYLVLRRDERLFNALGVQIGRRFRSWEADYRRLPNTHFADMNKIDPPLLVEILAARGITIQEFLEKI